MVLAIPQADFMSEIQANTQMTIWLCLGALGGATMLGLSSNDSVSNDFTSHE
jgi:hypothetical protein